MGQTAHVPATWETLEKSVKGAPATGILAALKTSATAREKLDKAQILANYDPAVRALTALELACTNAAPKYAGDKWSSLRLAAEKIKRQVPDAKKELTEIFSAIELNSKVAKAADQNEATYETLWSSFDKDRSGLASAPSLALYTAALGKVPGLIHQANIIINIDGTISTAEAVSMRKKYQKQVGILNSINTELTNAQHGYVQAMNTCVQTRRDLLPVLDSVKPVLNQTITLLTGLKGKAEEARTNGDSAKFATVQKAAAMAAKGAVDRYQEVSEHYKPGTKLRDGKDSSEAGIHRDDQASVITPLNTPLFNSFKANSDLKRSIDALAAEIAGMFVTATAPSGPVRASGPTIGRRGT